jgi:signal transduction histidine kinase
MTSEQIAKIGAFMQFDRKKYEQQGVGLGLSLVYRLAELNHAHVHIESELSQGTTVTVIFDQSHIPSS